jgi:CubicO group peptidase (beta-lactamase class C family)
MTTKAWATTLAIVVVFALGLAAAPTTVDEVFAQYTSSTPGCAVGVAIDGKRVVIKGYGSADLEHDVPIGEETIFEGGSVSKQFTAAAMLLLARDRKLSIDDPVRKYVPEVPDFGAPLTIRHMLTTPAGCATGGASRTSRAGRGRPVSTPTTTSSTSSAARRR